MGMGLAFARAASGRRRENLVVVEGGADRGRQGVAMELTINPLVLATEAPPIPIAQAWRARYKGEYGPLIDLSQAVPGPPPPKGPAGGGGGGGEPAGGEPLRAHRRRSRPT